MTSSRVALVTGASSGFGQATTALLAKQGFQVFGTSRAPKPDSAGTYDMLPLDVGSETSVQACVQTILQRTGSIDLLVNNAGYAQGGALEENSLEDARAQFDTNVFGLLSMLKGVLPAMRQQGSGQIITISSVLGIVAMPYLGLYTSSKFALEGMIEALQYEVRPFQIRVSLVEPTFFRTKFVAQPPATPWRCMSRPASPCCASLTTRQPRGQIPNKWPCALCSWPPVPGLRCVPTSALAPAC
jgi:NAD(P)-dependent dehydrogenase (short-subunit alcohol dehydrogenase family)